MRCKTCHYSLANLPGPEHRCPECGRAFDPKDARTFLVSGSRASFWIVVVGLIVASLCWVLLFGTIYFFDEEAWPARPWNRPTLPTWYLIRSFLSVAFFTWVLAFAPVFFLTLILVAARAALRRASPVIQ
jgi:hypothetical protein